MIKKRIIIVTLIITLLASMVACRNDDTVTENDSSVYGTITEDTIKQTDEMVIYDFGTERNIGATEYMKDTIDFEGYYGMRLKTSGSKLIYSCYSHSKTAKLPDSITLYPMDDEWNLDIQAGKTLAVKALDTDNTVDLKDLKDGLYAIVPSYSTTAGKTNKLLGCLYMSSKKLYTCRITSDILTESYRETWKEYTDDLDPEDYLSLEGITYPTSGLDGHAVHTQKWADLGLSMIKDEWTDEAKLFTFASYLAKNYAYDSYRVNSLHQDSRAKTAKNWNDDNMFMYGNHVGVCWDYTNALAIMCRAAGIPCTSVDNPTHTWNAVYINGKWISVDICELAYYQCETKNTDKKYWTECTGSWEMYGDNYGCYPEHDIKSTSQNIWTEYTATQ